MLFIMPIHGLKSMSLLTRSCGVPAGGAARGRGRGVPPQCQQPDGLTGFTRLTSRRYPGKLTELSTNLHSPTSASCNS